VADTAVPAVGDQDRKCIAATLLKGFVDWLVAEGRPITVSANMLTSEH